MEEKSRFKESYEIIEKKLELAELTLELGEITRQKWERLATMKDILGKEENLIKQIADRTQMLRAIMK